MQDTVNLIGFKTNMASEIHATLLTISTSVVLLPKYISPIVHVHLIVQQLQTKC